MADVHVVGTGNWSNGATWSTNPALPAAGDNIIFDGAYVVTMDIAATPALGTITSAGVAGQITCDTSARSYTINATSITPGTVGAGGFIRCTGDGANTFVLNADIAAGESICFYFNGAITSFTFNGNVIGGSVAGAHGIYCVENNQVVILNGTVTGGSAANTHGYYNYYTGTVTVNGNVIGGTGAASYGIFNNGAGTVTIGAGVTFTNGSGGVAYAGKPPTWTPAASTTMTWGATVFAPVVDAANLKKDVVNGSVTGTLVPTHGIL